MPTQPSFRQHQLCDFCGAKKIKQWKVHTGWYYLTDFRSHTGNACPTCFSRIKALTPEQGRLTVAVAKALTR